ncbi:uncharacterized protein LOC144477933 [Augochlora pura]
MSLKEIIAMLSFAAQLLLYFIRYFTSVLTFPTARFVLDNMQSDYRMLDDPVEVEMLLKDSIVAKRIIMVYVALTCTGSLCLIATLGLSTFLPSDIQIHFLYLWGYFYDEKSALTNLACLYVILSTMNGLLTLTCSEGSITVFATHLSGILEITSYRMQKAINKVATSDTFSKIDIQPAVEMHLRAIRLVSSLISNCDYW